MGEVRVQVLGRFGVEVDQLTVSAESFERRSGADLVALLAISRGHRLHRDQVLDALWPDATRASAMNRMNKAATYARHALGRRDAIVSKSDTVALFPEDELSVDAVAVEEPADAAELANLADLAARGPLLPDLPYEEWTIEARNRLLVRQLEVLRQAGRWSSILELDPADEGAHLALMKQSLASGDHESVLRRFEALENELATNLGVVPSAAAIALRDAARRSADEAPVPDLSHVGVRAFVMTDLAGSTKRWEDDPDQMAEVLARHDRVLDAAFTDAGGIVFKHTGDGMCVAFTSAAAAVDAALSVQRRMQATTWPGERPLVRIGIDMGEAQHRDGDWFGRPLNRTARIMDAGSGDQILCSGVVAEMVAHDVDVDVSISELGLHRLAGLAPLSLYKITASGIESAATPPRSIQVAGRELPELRAATFGRSQEQAALADELTRERMVSLVGPGGAGKTHLALHVGAEMADQFTGGAWFCQLGTVDDGSAAAQEILGAIGGLQHGAVSVAESIITTLGGREVLLLIDNCEHVVDSIGPLVGQLLAECSGVRVLATSRTPLRAPGERVHRIDPLDRAAAVELFVSETRRHGVPLESTEPAVARICARLDDLPLAVRLAAARARSLDLETLEALLADRFEFLSETETGALEHQQTLRTTIAWSVNALDLQVREFLTAISVFPHRFDMADIGAVTEVAPVQRIAMVDDLIQRSLLIGPEPSDLGPSYRLLESVRLYVREQLPVEVRHRFVTHILECVKAWREGIGSPDNMGVRSFAARWDDLRLAVMDASDLGRDDDLFELLSRAGIYGNIAMRFEMLEWYERVLDAATTNFASTSEARAYAGWAVLANFHGDWQLAGQVADNVIAAEPDLAEAAWAKSWLCYTDGDLDGAREWLDQIIDNPSPEAFQVKFGAIHTRTTIDFADDKDLGDAAHLLDVLSVDLGAPARSLALGTRALHRLWTDGDGCIADAEACIELSDRWGLVNSSMTGRSIRAFALVAHGRLDHALEAVHQLQAFASERGLWHWALSGLATAGAAFERAGRIDAAVTALGARDAANYQAGFSANYAVLQADRLRKEHADGFDGWWDAGHHLSPAEAASYVMATVDGLLTT